MGNEAATRVSCGDHTSENVGMSSEGRVRISSAECPSEAKVVIAGSLRNVFRDSVICCALEVEH